MKWQSFPMSIAKTFSLALSTFTMVMAPVAQGAEAKKKNPEPVKVSIDYSQYKWDVNKQNVQEFMKTAGLNQKNLTVGDFYQKMRRYYPAYIQPQMDQLVAAHRSEPMPKFEVSTYKDVEGKEQIRIQVTGAGESTTMSFAPGSTDKFIKYNNSYLAKSDILYPEQAVLKLAQTDKGVKKSLSEGTSFHPLKAPIKLTYEEYLKLTPRQRAEYMYRIRKLVDSAETVLTLYHGKKTADNIKIQYFVQWMMGLEADAAKAKRTVSAAGSDLPNAGDPCVVAGYISVYGENKYCGGNSTGRTHLREQMKKYGGASCGGTNVSCNPLVYGYSSGKAICVDNPGSDILNATSDKCASKSPLRAGNSEDKKRIIESYMNSKGADQIDLQFDADGKVSREQFDKISGYLSELNAYIDKAVETCMKQPLSSIQTVRDDQMNACRAIALRKIQVDPNDVATVIPPPPAPVPRMDCDLSKPGSIANTDPAAKEQCVCKAGWESGMVKDGKEELTGCLPPVVDAVAVPVNNKCEKKCNDDEKLDEKTCACEATCGFFCKNKGLLIVGGIAAGIGLLWFLNRDRGPKTPANPCLTAPTLCLPTTPTTPVTPPTVQPPPTTQTPTPTPPITVVTPTPTPPIIPPPVPTVEDTSNTNTSNAGGVRKQKGTR